MPVQFDFLLSQVRTSATSLAAGHVYFYLPGTTTPSDVWLDPGGSVRAANPYTLDANGTAQLYGTGTYRVVIKDASGVTRFDRDNISAHDLQNQTVIDVRTFTGSDIGARINAAAAYAGTIGGATIVIPANPGRVSTPIVISSANITLKGAGRTATALKAADNFNAAYIINVSSAPNFQIRDLEIDGNQTVLDRTDSMGVHFLSSPGSIVDNCYIHNLALAGVGVYLNSDNVTVQRCAISDIFGVAGSSGVLTNSLNTQVLFNAISRCNRKADEVANGTDDGNGIYFSTGADFGIAEGNFLRDHGRRGVKIQASGVKTTLNDMDDCAQSGVQIQLATGITDNIVLQNVIKMTNYGTYGVVLENLVYNTHVGMNIIDGAFYTGIDIRNGVIGANITGNTLRNTAGWGMRIENIAATNPSSSISVTDNLLFACGNTNVKPSIEARPGLAPVAVLTITDNTITGNTSGAITVGDNQTGVTLHSNNASPVVPYGAVGLSQNSFYGGVSVSNFGVTNVFNANSTMTDLLIDFQVGGVSKAQLDFAGGFKATNIYSPLVRTYGDNTNLGIQGSRNYSTSGTAISILSGGTISYGSGFIGMNLVPLYNQAGTGSNTDFRINRTETALTTGVQRLISAGSGGGSYVEKWGVNNKGYTCENVGGVVASAATITPTGPIFHISGTTTVNTINLPETGFIGKITVILDGAVPFGTSGNIATAFTGAAGFAYTFTYDGTKWYPSH